MKSTPGYAISMTGAQGAGKKTLRDGLVGARLGFRAADVDLLRLGRMVDAEGLLTFRERIDKQDRSIRVAAAEGWAVTSRLAPLDVAVIAYMMGAFGRIERTIVDGYLRALEHDLDGFAMPSALVAVLCPAEILARRLEQRDRTTGLKAPRGLSRLERLAAQIESIFRRGDYPTPIVARIVGGYREAGRLLVVDTGESDAATALSTVRAFVEATGAARPPETPR